MLFSVFLASAAALVISDSRTNDSSSILNGIVFEDINHSGDGGIYGELLANRAFQGDGPSTHNYTGVNAKLQLTNESLSDALPHSLLVNGDGFYNEGYWGIKVSLEEYTARFYYKGNASLGVELRSLNDNTTFATAKPTAVTEDDGIYIAQSNGFRLYEAKLKPSKSASDLNNGLFIYGSGHYSLISLFGPTYNDRPNGLRKDLAEAVVGFGPHFLRFPGANNLEGEGGPETRWKWNETIGPLINRPGRQGDWGYPTTDGLGLHEYFDWIEDMNLTAILGVWAGFTLEPSVVPEDELQPYIDDVLHELEYILGDSSTEYGSLRVKNGRASPWQLEYVEIGNEDFFDLNYTYGYRFPAFNKAIKEKYPHITTIATTQFNISNFPNETTWWDQHYYQTPQWFVDQFDEYDNYPRNATKIFVGEYGAAFRDGHNGDMGPGGRYFNPTVYGAVSEAVYMAGLERNSDQVKAACYAPIIENVNHYNNRNQLHPKLVDFDAGTVNVTPSYQVQKLWSTTQGDRILTLENATFGPLYYVANIADDQLHVKISNPTNQTAEFSAIVDVSGFDSGSASAKGISSSNPEAIRVDIKPWNVDYTSKKLRLTMKPYSAGVITVEKKTGDTRIANVGSSCNFQISITILMVAAIVDGLLLIV